MPTPRPLTNTELNDILRQLYNTALKHNPIMGRVFRFQYDTGCRFNELLYLQEWELDPQTKVLKFFAKKNKRWRYLPYKRLSTLSKETLEFNLIDLHGITYGRANRYMQQLLSSKPLTLQQKYLFTHAFRHNYARKLFDKGRTVEQVKDDLGISSIDVARGYLFSTIMQVQF
jgi:site-specific recombinase XerD